MRKSILVISCMSLGLLSSRFLAMVKKSAEPKQKYKVVLEFDLETIQEIDRQVHEASLEGKASRTSVCKSIIEHAVCRDHSKEEQLLIYHKLIRQAAAIREKASKHAKKRDYRVASTLFIQSAAKELEALYMMRDRSESMIKSVMIHVVQALKQGTGYRSLPEVPDSRISVEMSS